MFDCHYDLLTYIYMNKNNISEVKEYCKKVYNKKNIIGSIFNLFYMSPQEMKEELNINYDEINTIKNLQEVKYLIKKYEILPKKFNYIIGIEGLDYLENIEDIDILYDLGLRSTNIVWNNKNKFGGGIKADKNYGLTSSGKELLEKLIKKKIAIDLSHSNEKTFFDIIEICNKFKELNPLVFASHSNCKQVCNVPRNLTDEQILRIKEFNGVIGVVSIKNFCNKDYEQNYIEHINHIKKITGGIQNICVATDDMRYYKIKPKYYQNMNIFKQETVSKDIQNLLLKNNYSKEDITKIMYKNFYNFLEFF